MILLLLMMIMHENDVAAAAADDDDDDGDDDVFVMQGQSFGQRGPAVPPGPRGPRGPQGPRGPRGGPGPTTPRPPFTWSQRPPRGQSSTASAKYHLYTEQNMSEQPTSQGGRVVIGVGNGGRGGGRPLSGECMGRFFPPPTLEIPVPSLTYKYTLTSNLAPPPI